MKLVKFSVNNFRSITTAHNVIISDTTVLIGRNNEGKSNLLKALDIGMTSLQRHAAQLSRGKLISGTYRRYNQIYSWTEDFPIALQSKKDRNKQTIIGLEFLLNEIEIKEFKNSTKSNLNGTLPILIKLGESGKIDIKVSKRGNYKLNHKSDIIAAFIANKIAFNYIPAIRTDQEAMEVVSKMLEQDLGILEKDPTYMEALKTIQNIQKPILEILGNSIKDSLSEFLPSIRNVSIEINENTRKSVFRRDFDIIVDDGTPTSLSFKGDGVKSLAALGLLKGRIKKDGASIIAIEEPESHLHPGAIHQLNEVIKSLAVENQVILTTHNPLFVDRNNISSNIIVERGKALPAKNTKQIRELLGIKSSDNLMNASYVLIVEGEDDAISLKALICHMSVGLKKMINNHTLIVDFIKGAGNLSYQLGLLRNTLCIYHCFLDNDKAGRSAFAKAEGEGMISTKNCTFATCSGSQDSEFEDCLNQDIYKNEIMDKFGVDLSVSRSFRGSAKWSDRIKDTFKTNGKLWNYKVESDVKYCVASCVEKNPQASLSEHKRSSIDALISSLKIMTGVNE